MWKVIKYPERSQWKTILARPSKESAVLLDTVTEVMNNVRNQGDDALLKYTKQFDKAELHTLKVTDEEFVQAESMVSEELKQAMDVAINNISAFHKVQYPPFQEVETMLGIKCWRKTLPIQRVGLYVPGGSAPLFSTVLMLGIPAKIAGCERIVFCTPPSADGTIHPAVLTAAKKIGLTEIYKVGGIQAIAAMTFGTQTVPNVYKIFGPGNQWVMAAKQYATNYGVAIDMPAGPSEVLIIADKSCRPDYIAADLLSQAEHGPDSQVILLTNEESVIQEVEKQLNLQLSVLKRKEIAEKALSCSKIILLENMDLMLEMSNEYAPEHLILAVEDLDATATKVRNAGSVFLGNYACESAGDYASGTNHSLPTSGYAKSYSGVSVDSFVKRTTFQYLTKQGINGLGKTISIMAQAESLDAHANAADIRMKE